MNKESIRTLLEDYFSKREDVGFVCLFGSFVSSERFRDIDIGVFFNPVPDLIRFGSMQSEVHQLVGYKVDLVILNDLYKKKPDFAYQIVTDGELLMSNDRDGYVQYKSKAWGYYFDTAYLREKVNAAFSRRMKSSKFGSRNYE